MGIHYAVQNCSNNLSKKYFKLPVRIQLSLVYCIHCTLFLNLFKGSQLVKTCVKTSPEIVFEL